MSLSEQLKLKMELIYGLLLDNHELTFELEDLYGSCVLPAVPASIKEGSISATWESNQFLEEIHKGDYILAISDRKKVYKEVFKVTRDIFPSEGSTFSIEYPFNIS